MDWLNPDGEFSDEERARKRGIVLGTQEFDGMSRLSGLVTPELRAAIEAMLAKLAAPGACNPDDETPFVDEEPSEVAVRRDHRSAAQRNHDGFLAGMRGLLLCGKQLGQHNGLPVSIIVSTTLQDLEAATGKALTGGGSIVPMSDVIRWASHAHHYLASAASPWRCITPSAWPRPRSESCSTARNMAAPSPAATPRPTPARSTTSKAGPKPTAPTSTTSPWPAARTTDSSKKAGPPAKTPKATPNGYRRRHLDYGQPRTNTFHHPEKLLAPDDEPD